MWILLGKKNLLLLLFVLTKQLTRINQVTGMFLVFYIASRVGGINVNTFIKRLELPFE